MPDSNIIAYYHLPLYRYWVDTEHTKHYMYILQPKH